jgi:hypothetical protein
MAKRIAWTGQAKADVRALDRQTAMRILHGLARFIETEEGDVKRLQRIEPPEFRLRLGCQRGPPAYVVFVLDGRPVGVRA